MSQPMPHDLEDDDEDDWEEEDTGDGISLCPRCGDETDCFFEDSSGEDVCLDCHEKDANEPTCPVCGFTPAGGFFVTDPSGQNICLDCAGED